LLELCFVAESEKAIGIGIRAHSPQQISQVSRDFEPRTRCGPARIVALAERVGANQQHGVVTLRTVASGELGHYLHALVRHGAERQATGKECDVHPLLADRLGDAFVGAYRDASHRPLQVTAKVVEHRLPRLERFGWAAARLDDIVNLPAARLAGLAVLAVRPARAADAWHAWRRDAHRHPSPNAGVIEAAFAGSLGIRLGGTNRYHGSRIEHRAAMGDGRPAETGDIDVAVRLARRVDRTALAVVVLALIAGGRR